MVSLPRLSPRDEQEHRREAFFPGLDRDDDVMATRRRREADLSSLIAFLRAGPHTSRDAASSSAGITVTTAPAGRVVSSEKRERMQRESLRNRSLRLKGRTVVRRKLSKLKRREEASSSDGNATMERGFFHRVGERPLTDVVAVPFFDWGFERDVWGVGEERPNRVGFDVVGGYSGSGGIY
jgi:hypothetical protein